MINENMGNKFTQEFFENLFGIILDKDVGKIVLQLILENTEEAENVDIQRLARSTENLQSFGLKFIMQNRSEIQLDREIGQELFKAIISIGTYFDPNSQQVVTPVPEQVVEGAQPGALLISQQPSEP